MGLMRMTAGAYRASPARLGGDLRVRVDAPELGQRLLVDLLQVLLQRQISVCEEPEAPIETNSLGCVLQIFSSCIKTVQVVSAAEQH